MSIEQLGFFVRYLPPMVIGLVAVAGLAHLTRWLPSILGRPELADSMELFAFSVVVSGPFVFAAVFVTSFFAIAWFSGENSWAKLPLAIALLVFSIVLVCHFSLLPRR
ncbi:MAG: hypothetical protein M5U13_13150 [Thermoanaerobaculia bacterium]|nr:hypothetical protein [Thermoanaerobaculia bacterium]